MKRAIKGDPFDSTARILLKLVLVLLLVVLFVQNQLCEGGLLPHLMENDEKLSINDIWKSFKGMNRYKQHKIRGITKEDIKSPLILVGGFGGSSLMSMRTNANEPHMWCSSTTEKPFQVWVGVKELIPYVTEECTVHDMKLEMRGNPKRMHPLDPGVSITGKDVGGLSGVNYITDTELVEQAAYMTLLTSYLIKYGGYQGGKSLRAMTYDWRTGPVEWKSPRVNNTGGDWDLFKKLIEETYQWNNKTKVSLLGHSLGGPFVQLFLVTHVSKEWKQQYIKQFVSVAGTYDGSTESPILHTVGANYGFSFLTSQFKQLARTFASVSIMYPLKYPFNGYPLFIYHNNQTGEHVEYHATLDDYRRYLEDSGVSNGWSMFMHEYSAILNDKERAPEVPLHCFHGNGIQTVTQFVYEGPKRMADILSTDLQKTRFEDGDGTVLDYCLKMCSSFVQQEPITTSVFPHATHNGLMKEERMFTKLLEIL